MNKEIKKITQMVASYTIFFMKMSVIYWAWTILCPYLNAPQFSYGEIMILYMTYKILMPRR